MAAQSIPVESGGHLGAQALVEVGISDLLCEWNDLDAALAHMKQGLSWLPMWGKADDWLWPISLWREFIRPERTEVRR